MNFFTPDGKSLLFFEDNKKQLVFRHVLTGEVNHVIDLNHYAVSIFHLRFSPDGTKLLLLAHDLEPRLLDVPTGRELQVFEPIDINWAIWGAFSNDGRHILVGGPYEHICCWDIYSGQRVQQYHHERGLYYFDVTRDNRYLIGGAYDTNAGIWSWQTGEKLHTIPVDEMSTVLVLPDDEHALICAFKCGLIVHLASGQIVKKLDESDDVFMIDAAAALDAKRLITNGSRTAIAARIWDIQTWELVIELKFSTPLPEGSYPSHVDISPDGRYAATAEALSPDLYIWDATTGTLLRQYERYNYFFPDA